MTRIFNIFSYYSVTVCNTPRLTPPPPHTQDVHTAKPVYRLILINHKTGRQTFNFPCYDLKYLVKNCETPITKYKIVCQIVLLDTTKLHMKLQMHQKFS